MEEEKHSDQKPNGQWKLPLSIVGLCLVLYFLSFGLVSALYWKHDWYMYPNKIKRYKIAFAPFCAIHQGTPVLNGYVVLWVRIIHPGSKTFEGKEIKRLLSGRWHF